GGGWGRRGAGAWGRREGGVQERVTGQAGMVGLPGAERAEAAGSGQDARRQYTALAAFDDTGPSALLGLARVLARVGDGRTAGVLDELDRRFGERGFGEVPARVIAATLRAAPVPGAPGAVARARGIDAVLGVADDVLAGKYG